MNAKLAYKEQQRQIRIAARRAELAPRAVRLYVKRIVRPRLELLQKQIELETMPMRRLLRGAVTC